MQNYQNHIFEISKVKEEVEVLSHRVYEIGLLLLDHNENN